MTQTVANLQQLIHPSRSISQTQRNGPTRRKRSANEGIIHGNSPPSPSRTGGKSSVRPCAPGGLVDKILHQRGRCTAHREYTQNAEGLALCVTATGRIRPAQCGVGVCAVPILGSGLRPRLCARRCLRPDRASLFCFLRVRGRLPGRCAGPSVGSAERGACGNRGGMRAPLHRGGKRAGVSRCNARGLPPEYAAQTRRKWAELEFGTFGGACEMLGVSGGEPQL